MRLGIDFGTTRTVVVAARDGRRPIVAFDDHGEFREYIPGVAALRDGELVLGWDAARALADGSADHAVRSIKRVAASLPPDAPVPGLPGVTALELVTGFLAELRAALVDRSNLDLADSREPLEAMVAVPASSASRQRWLTLEAFRRAGFTPIGLLNEPTAAAVEFADRHLGELGRRSPKRYVVIYDLGGGTFDTSAVSLDGRRFDLIASEGLARVGGDDLDELILTVAGIPSSPAALERARDAKETLRPTTRRLGVDAGDGEVITIDVAELYARAQPLIDRTLAATDTLFDRLRERGIDPDDPRELGGLYLVGGAAAFPAVQRAVRARFGKKLQLAPQPFAATAVGLAIAADPGASVIIREAITRHFGVWREGDGGTDRVFDPLLGKHTAASDGPLVVRRRYRPIHAIGHLRFVECGALDDAGQPVQDLVPWTDVFFPYDPALADRGDLASLPNERRSDLLANEIAETYTYSPEGTISVRIENLSRGYARTFSLGALALTLLVAVAGCGSYVGPIDADNLRERWSPNVRINDDGTGEQQREVSLAADTRGNWYAAWMDERNGVAALDYCAFSGSSDGTTWSPNEVDKGPFNVCGDPVVAGDTSGNLYRMVIAANFELTPVILPVQTEVQLARSTDGGNSWGAWHTVTGPSPISPAPPAGINDKAWVAADGDRVVVAWTVLDRFLFGNLEVARSDDGGTTFGPPQTIGQGVGTCVLIDAARRIHVAWGNDVRQKVQYRSSEDGGTTWSTMAEVGDIGAPSADDIPDIVGCAADTTGDNLYLVWTGDTGGGTFDVWVAHSGDHGATWGPPVKVNDDTTSARQARAWIGVDETGAVQVAWADWRSGAARAYAAVSRTHGQTWEANQMISDGGGTDNAQDYNGMAVSPLGEVGFAWTDDRSATTRMDVYFARKKIAAP